MKWQSMNNKTAAIAYEEKKEIEVKSSCYDERGGTYVGLTGKLERPTLSLKALS